MAAYEHEQQRKLASQNASSGSNRERIEEVISDDDEDFDE